MTTEELMTQLPKGLLGWYPFEAGSKILYITDASEALLPLFQEKGLRADCVKSGDLQQLEEHIYDYAAVIGVLEQNKNPQILLKECRRALKTDGVLLLGVDNRLGLRYFCGDRDPFTERNFDGIERYRRVVPGDTDGFTGRTYALYEVKEMLGEAGFSDCKAHAVLPNLTAPQLIYAQGETPKEELSIRYFPTYDYPDTVFLEEEFLYTDFAKNGMFHTMANAYLIECAANGAYAPMRHVTISTDRGEKSAMYTIIRTDDKVEKQAMYPEGEARLAVLSQNMQDLKKRGISVVPSAMIDGKFVMPYVQGEIAVSYFQRLIKEDKELFIRQMDCFRNLVLQSSEHISGEEESNENEEVILEKAYVDMVPLNCFYSDGRFVFFDQEFYLERTSANVVIIRLLDIVYRGNFWMEKIIPMQFFLERYGLKKKADEYRRIGNDFLMQLRNQKQLSVYNEKHHANLETVHSNRQRMNYSETTYQRLFVDIFSNLEGRKLLIFGSGNFAQKFLKLYGKDYPVYAVIDNNKEKWGQKIFDVEIHSPEILKEMEANEYKVIVCIKSYTTVLQQLEEAGTRYIGVYDTNLDYPHKQKVGVLSQPQSAEPATDTPRKKYRVGYIAGVFDLFHIGHLNLLKRAKEQCEYLIVGVVTDEGVRINKKTEPYVPFEERIEIVRACRYVDEAVEIPYGYGGTRDAHRLYHFDCQFSGSDYIEDPGWLSEKEYLEKHGAEMVFFPYTQSTSSTKLKATIDKKLSGAKQ